MTFGEYIIKSAGPWCQGPVLLQALNILEHCNLKEMGHNSGEYIHTITEALKLAFADREKFFGDPQVCDGTDQRFAVKGVCPEMCRPYRDIASANDASFGNPWEFNAAPMPDGYDMARHSPAAQSKPQMTTSTPVMSALLTRMATVSSSVPSDMSFSGPVIPGTGIVASTRGSQSFVDEKHASSVAGGNGPGSPPHRL